MGQLGGVLTGASETLPLAWTTQRTEIMTGGLSVAASGADSRQGSAPGKWLKLADAAHVLGVSEVTLRRRVRVGRLPFEFRGGRYYVFIPDGADAEFLLGEAGPVPVTGHIGSPGASRSTLPARAAQEPSPSHPSWGARGVSPDRERYAGGPSPEQIAAILTIELREKEKEIAELRRALTDQVTLNEALEAALSEALGGVHSA